MFQGEYRHSVDAKGRIIIPSAIRNLCEGSVTVARGFDNCLALYTQNAWEPFCNKLLALPTYKKDVRNQVRVEGNGEHPNPNQNPSQQIQFQTQSGTKTRPAEEGYGEH